MLATSPSQILLLGTQSTTTGAYTGVTTGMSQWIPVAGYDELVFTFESSGTGTTSGGTLKIEEASRSGYSGTASQIGSDVSASSFTGLAQLAVHVNSNAFAFVRVRISSDITGGGTVLVFLNRQGS